MERAEKCDWPDVDFTQLTKVVVLVVLWLYLEMRKPKVPRSSLRRRVGLWGFTIKLTHFLGRGCIGCICFLVFGWFGDLGIPRSQDLGILGSWDLGVLGFGNLGFWDNGFRV